MKKTLLSLVLILLSLKIAAQCGDYYEDKLFSLTDVKFWDANNGFVIGGSSLLTTHDGGVSWESYELPYVGVPAFNDTELVDSDKAVIVGSNGIILYTDDKGVNWQRKVGAEGLEYYTGVHFVNASIGYAVGVTGYPFNNETFIYKTTDGGQNWSALISNISTLDYNDFTPADVLFVDENTGYTWGGNDFYKTTDGGANWVAITNPSNTFINKLQFIDAQTAFMSAGSWVYKTTDNGTSWTQTAYSLEWTSGAFTAKNNHLYYARNAIGGIKKIDITTDTQIVNSIIEQTGYVNDIYFIDDMTGFTVGKKRQSSWSMGRFIYKTTDGGLTWVQLDGGATKEGNSNRANYFKKINENEYVYCVNSGGNYTHSSILLSKDKGASWQKIYEKENVSGRTLYAEGNYMSHWSYVNPNSASDGFKIAESLDKGVTWTEGPTLTLNGLPSGSGYTVNAIKQVSENDLFIDNYTNLYHSIDKGLTWNLVTTPSGVINRQYQFLDENNFVFYGSGPNSEPTMYLTNDGGLTWTLVAQISGYGHSLQFDRFDYSHPDKIYIYPRYPGGKVFTYDITTQTLSEETVPYFINKIKAIGNNSLIIIDNSQNSYISTDNGATWTERAWESYGTIYPNIYIENESTIIFWEYNFIQFLKNHDPLQPEAIYGNDNVFENTEWEYLIPADLVSTTQWSLDSGGTLIVDPTTSYYTVKVFWDTPGVHTLKAKRINDCGESQFTEIQVTVNPELSIDEFNKEQTKIYPNPFSNELQIVLPQSFPTNDIQLTLTNMLGQTIFEKQVNATSGTITLRNISSSIKTGMYFIKIASKNTSLTRKIIKK